MATHLTRYITSLPTFRTLYSLARSDGGLHLREIAAILGLSPSGVLDIMRRLLRDGLVIEKRKGNKKFFLTTLPKDDIRWLESAFNEREQANLLARASTFSVGAKEKLLWMDEAYLFFNQLKNVDEHPIATTQTRCSLHGKV